MKLLGIDYGDRHLGLAIADSETKLASPWQIIGNNFIELKRIITEEKIEKIVVGRPIGHRGQLAKTKKFLELLKNNLTLPIDTEDERFSTVMANKLIKGNKKKGERDDAISAMLILQSYLDRK
ncbi:MAG: Holliday junction resolvase RuvX [bacterium]